MMEFMDGAGMLLDSLYQNASSGYMAINTVENADERLKQLRELYRAITEQINRYVIYMRAQCADLDDGTFQEDVSKRVDDTRRRYSKGLNMWALGFYHPTVLKTVVVDNMKRGRLVRTQKNNRYTYEYDEHGALMRITDLDGSTVTYCFARKIVKAFFTFRSVNGCSEVESVAIALYHSDGTIMSLINVLWANHMKLLCDIDLEIYAERQKDRQECHMITVGCKSYPDDGCTDFDSIEYLLFDDKWTLLYDECDKMIDFEWNYRI